MAYSSAAMSANEQSWVADDKPFLSANTAMELDDAQWVVGTTAGDWGDSSDDATGFEGHRAVDGYPGLVTKPNAADTSFTLVFDWSSSPIDFDWIGILNSNLYTLTTTQLSVQVADDSGISTNVATVTNRNISTAYSSERRFADINIGHSVAWTRYTSVPYARLQIVCSSGTPQIGQVIFGRRRQQYHNPTMPWDSTGERSSMDDFRGRDGMLSRQPRYKARREMRAMWRHSIAALQTDVLAWWDEIEEGARPYFFHDAPNTSPDDFSMMLLRTPSLRYPWSTNTTRDLVVDGIEQGPSYFSLE